MATFIENTPLDNEETNLTANILDLNSAPHSLVFADRNQVLTVRNGEAVPITINLLGDTATSFNIAGYGSVDVSAGKDVIVAAGDTVDINLTKIVSYLRGNSVAVTVTGSTAPELATAYLSSYR